MAYHWPIFLESENNSDSLNTSGSEKAQPQNPMESFLLRLCATWKDTKTKIIPICSLILGIISRKKRGTILYFVGLLVFSLSIVTLSHFGDSNKMRMTSHARAKTGGLQQHVLSIETGTGKPRRYLNKGSIGHSAAMHRMGSRHSHYSLHYYPPLELNPNEELAAVIAFLAASPSNALPPFIDPTRPLDPRLVLGFDTSRESAISEIAALTRDTWKDYPVVLLSKLYSPVGRELKSILSSYSLKSQPLIWELDARQDSHVITPLLFRLLNITDLPVLLVGGLAVDVTRDGIAPRSSQADGAALPTTSELLTRWRQLNETGDLKQLLVVSDSLKNG